MSISKKTLSNLNVFFNFVILILVIIIFVLMINLLRNEYFIGQTTNAINRTSDARTQLVLQDSSPSITSNISMNIEDKNVANNVADNVSDNVSNTSNNKPLNSVGSKKNYIENFMAYLDEQKFCPNIYNSMTSFWTRFPEKYGGGYMGKFCCTSCYFLVSEEIYCGENQYGKYVLDRLNVDDIALLKEYYDKTKADLDFEFPIMKLNALLGKAALKYKFMNEKYYPIQIIKTMEELNIHEEIPTINESLYQDSYKCKEMAKNRDGLNTAYAS